MLECDSHDETNAFTCDDLDDDEKEALRAFNEEGFNEDLVKTEEERKKKAPTSLLIEVEVIGFHQVEEELDKKQKEADYAGSQLEQDTVEEQVGSLGSFRVPGSSRIINTPSENPALSDMRTKDITPASMSKRSANDETASSAVI